MRPVYFALLSAFLAKWVVSSVAPVALARSDETKFSFNPTNVDLRHVAHMPLIPMTNAQRFARGLTPVRPRLGHYSGRMVRRGVQYPPPPRHSASSSDSGAATCSTSSGRLQISGGSYTGNYVSASTNSYGEYTVINDATQALLVQLTLCDGDSGPYNLVTTNGVADYPYFGGVAGFAGTDDNIGSGSSNYAYCVGTSITNPGAPASDGANSYTQATNSSKDIESAIWNYDSNTDAITAQWINTDSSKPTTYIAVTSSTLLITGDVVAFADYFGPTTMVNLTFVQV